MHPRTTQLTRPLLALLATAAVAIAGVPAAAPTVASEPAKPFDLNGDGRAEVVTGIPTWNAKVEPPRITDSGAVLILWGGRNRTEETLLSQEGTEVPGEPGIYDRFGHVLDSADFDRDGFADLAVGAPFDGRVGDSYGTVTIFYGSPSGVGSRVVQLSAPGHAGFGGGLVAADFTRDGYPDLAVGAVGDNPREEQDYGSGAVVVLRGGPTGFSLGGATVIARPDPAMASFGSVLAAGDVNGDGYQDLIEGYAGVQRWIDDPPVPGHVTYALSGPAGPTTAAKLSDRSASSIAVGDVTKDGRADVVVGSALRTAYTEDDPMPRGRVTLFRGTASGPSATGSTLTQATRGVPGTDESGDLFGAAVALSDVDRDGRLDLLVGAPGEDRARGRVTIVRGTRNGFASRGNISLDQASPGVPGSRERGDRFGADLTAVDVSSDGRRDLVIGSPGENRAAGSVTVIRLAGALYRARGVDTFTLDSLRRTGGGRAVELGAVL